MGMMSVGEQDRLMKEKYDMEPIPLQNISAPDRQPQQYQQQQQQQYSQDDVSLPVDGGLEPVGLSFGSMMSIGTTKLENAGLSFGSTMSYSVAGGAGGGSGAPGSHGRHGSFGGAPPAAVDGGLQDIGTSFGSLSLADGERERIIAAAERDMMMMESAAAAAPTLLQQQKSTGNLLDCSDTDSDDEETSAEASAQQSAQWEKLQAALAEQDKSIRNSQTTAAMPPPSAFSNYHHHGQQQQQQQRGGGHNNHPALGSTFQIPAATNLDRDFSQMSAISVAEDFEPAPASYPGCIVPNAASHYQQGNANNNDGFNADMPPPPPEMKKERSDDWSKDVTDLEYTYLNRGNSLASENFD